MNLEAVGRGLFEGTVAGEADIIHEKYRDSQWTSRVLNSAHSDYKSRFLQLRHRGR
jgi:hypothetical protein